MVDGELDEGHGERADAASLFVPVTGGREDTWLATELARGPWDPGALHGGPVAALLARSVEAAVPAGDGQVCRFTLELLRPVPIAPLTPTAAVIRPGRKVQLVEAELSAGDRAVARCRALWIRTGAAWAGTEERQRGTPADGHRASPPGEPASRPFPGPEESAPRPFDTPYRAFHNAGAELRFALGGGFEEPGPAAVWIRLAVPVVPGEAPSPLQRAVAAADFGNGVSGVLPMDRWTFVNPDLTVSSWRRPHGEWIALEAATSLGAPGIALARSVLWDDTGDGPFGLGVQCLVVEPR